MQVLLNRHSDLGEKYVIWHGIVHAWIASKVASAIYRKKVLSFTWRWNYTEHILSASHCSVRIVAMAAAAFAGDLSGKITVVAVDEEEASRKRPADDSET